MRILQTTHLTKEYGQDASLVKALDDGHAPATPYSSWPSSAPPAPASPPC